MNFRPPASPRGGLHRCIRVLSLLLLQQALAPNSTDAQARSRLPSNQEGLPSGDNESRPYLRIAGMLPIRIKAVPPPPDLLSKPAAGAPPQPATASGAPGNQGPANHADEELTNKPAEFSPATTASNPTTPPEHAKNFPPILPDDSRPNTRPEDFLPFFQFPGPSRDVNVVVPVNVPRPPEQPPQPPSSATYQQK